MKDTDPGGPRNAWLSVKDEPSFHGLHPEHQWEPYLHVGDGYKSLGYKRADGAGYVLPVVDGESMLTGDWWATWAHPNMAGRPGWHHHAFGRYSSASAAAYAFDSVYALEWVGGNSDRCRELRASQVQS